MARVHPSPMRAGEEKEEKADPLSGFSALGSLIFDGGPAVVAVLEFLALGVLACCMFGLPVDTGSLVASFWFWMFIALVALGTLGLMTLTIGLARAGIGALTFAMLFLGLGAIWGAVVMGLMIFMLFACSAAMMCGDDYDCSGAVVAPYTGPTGRFIATFVVVIASWVMHAVAFFVALGARKTCAGHRYVQQVRSVDERREEAAAAASSSPPSTPAGSVGAERQQLLVAADGGAAAAGLRNRQQQQQQRQ